MNYLELIIKWHDLKEDKKSIVDFCNEEKITLSRDEKLCLLSNLVQKDVFIYSTLLKNSIPLVADTDDRFLEFLEEIEQITHEDMAVGWLEMALITIGKENSDLGISLFSKMKNSIKLVNFTSAPLGGVGYSDYSKIKKIVDLMLDSDDPKEIMLGLRTIRIAFTRKHLENQTELFPKIETLIQINDEKINLESTILLLEFYESNPIFCQTQLIRLATLDNKFKNIISHHLWTHPIKNSTNAMALIQECFNPVHPTSFSIFAALGNYTKTNPIEIMSIIRTALENKASLYGNLEELVKKLGKNSLLSSINEFENWLDTDDFHLKFSIPRFLSLLIPNKQKQSSFSYFKKWSESESIPNNLFLKIYNQVLATCYENDFDQDFIHNSKKLLIELTLKSGINISYILKDEDNETLQCARLIKGLEYYSDDLNYDRILSNLDFFPNLKNLLSSKWILEKKQEHNRTNLLLRVLERELPEDSKINEIIKDIKKAENEQEHNWNKLRLSNHIHDFLYLLNIEQNLQNFLDIDMNINSHFKKKLQNDEAVDDTISEINILGLLSKHYELKLEAPVGTKNIDSLIEIDGQKLYLEVINPSGFSPLDLFDGKVFNIPHRVKNKILDKCDQQLAQIPEDDIPAIIAIDIQKSDIDEDSITDALYGSSRYTFLMDSKTGEERGGYSSLNDNSIHRTKPQSDVLSGILCFKSEILNDMKFHITGKLILNPNAKNQIIMHLRKRIEEYITKLEN